MSDRCLTPSEEMFSYINDNVQVIDAVS